MIRTPIWILAAHWVYLQKLKTLIIIPSRIAVIIACFEVRLVVGGLEAAARVFDLAEDFAIRIVIVLRLIHNVPITHLIVIV
jgi:hypothetical protein